MCGHRYQQFRHAQRLVFKYISARAVILQATRDTAATGRDIVGDHNHEYGLGCRIT